MNTDRLLSIPVGSTTPRAGTATTCRAICWPTSRSILRSLGEGGRESPELYRRKVSGEIAEAESPALVLGRAAHCLILEGRAAFDRQYLVADGPVNPKTDEPYGKATRAYAEWLASQTRGGFN